MKRHDIMPARALLAGGLSRHMFAQSDGGVVQPPTRSAIDEAFAATHDTIAQLESERDLVNVGGEWSPTQMCRRSA